MKVYIRDFNNVLAPLKERFEQVEDPRDADVFVLWQDVRGDMSELCRINSEYLHKPVVVVQHGRGATNDYLPPNKFPMLCDKFCCWGIKEYERLERAGYADKAVITGSPLVHYITKKEEHNGNNIVFCPIVTNHEEPDNINIYWELKRLEIKKAQEKLMRNYDKLRDNWNAWEVEENSATEGSIPYYNFNKEFRIVAKLTGAHDKRLYMGDVIQTQQINKNHIQDCVRVLAMTDLVVGIEEGTFQLLAMAMGIPCISVNGFKYRWYGGIDYSSVEMIKTKSTRQVELSNIEQAIEEELKNPNALKEEREKVLKEEFWDGDCDPIANIEKVVKEVSNGS